jgi:DNA-binding FadR family transcriptional regulator
MNAKQLSLPLQDALQVIADLQSKLNEALERSARNAQWSNQYRAQRNASRREHLELVNAIAAHRAKRAADKSKAAALAQVVLL